MKHLSANSLTMITQIELATENMLGQQDKKEIGNKNSLFVPALGNRNISATEQVPWPEILEQLCWKKKSRLKKKNKTQISRQLQCTTS